MQPMSRRDALRNLLPFAALPVLPRAAGASAPAKGPVTDAAWAKTFPIVHVDDEPAIYRVLGRILKGEGFRTVSFTDGEKALAYCRAEVVSLVISDQGRPGMKGLELLAALRADPRTSDLPFIYLSGQATSLIKRTQKQKVEMYIDKPFAVFDLTMYIDWALRGPSIAYLRSRLGLDGQAEGTSKS